MQRSKQEKLGSEQKKAVGLLSIGTFLEYFDLMLYIHMAVLLNELFFPKTDPFTASLLSAFAFCSSYILRPFGALIFGFIGDFIGRKSVIVITTIIMAITCTTIAVLPTYAQIGITASWIITICRMVQGMAASAESRGAEIYITESIKPPLQYPLVAIITVFSAVGTSFALGISSIFTNVNIFGTENQYWRVAFFLGAIIGLVGGVARTSLREASEFANKKKMLKMKFADNKVEWDKNYFKDTFDNEKTFLTSLAYFIICCARPPCFYFIYIYCSDVLKHDFGLSAGAIISHNFWVSIVDMCGLLFLAYISSRIYPLKILKAKLFLFFTCIIFFPAAMYTYPSELTVFVFQCLASLFVFDDVPASPVFYKHFPIIKRFTYTSLLSSFAKLMTYAITSFGLVYSTKYFGYYGIFLILIPVGVVYYFAVKYFEGLEKVK
ncbi:MFS transporter [Candidatus Megaera polyxenophila]|jgi:MFS family permease|uniref:MFS transporter n=1 Tax=Candidatus Megaera polyxenophila TaxID=988779 RepID=UPI00249E776F|nr:MFS transporter [Candidatus Megaera polyxenophila]